jgi:hypothetical protein
VIQVGCAAPVRREILPDFSTPMAYNPLAMQFIETNVFTRQVVSLLADDDYSQLQMALFSRPDMGAIIPRSGGLRKIRWSISD